MKYILVFLLITCFSAEATVGYNDPIYPTATTVSTKILNVNNKRTYLLIQNLGSVGVYIDTVTQGGNVGILIPAGGSYEPIQAPINAIYVKTASSTTDLIVIQGQ